MKSAFRGRPLLLILLLLLGLGGLAAAIGKGNPAVSEGEGLACPQGVKCYSPSDLNGRSLWQASGLAARAFQEAVMVGPGDVIALIERYAGGMGYRTIDTAASDQIESSPAIFAFRRGDPPGQAAGYWPVNSQTVTALLENVDSFVAVGEVSGKPRMLLAARNQANMQRLVNCVLGGACPQLSRPSVSPWEEAAKELPEWADLAFTVDLRQPAGGTAIVYAQGRKSGFFFGGGRTWAARPTNLRATFHPESGRRSAEMPDYNKALTFDQTGRLVYEVEPVFQPSGVRSKIFSGGAYLSMSTLLPELGRLGGKKAAIRWLLPDGWSANTPWEKTGDDWYAVELGELPSQYIGVGPLSSHTFTAGQTSFTVGLLGNLDPDRRREWNTWSEASIRHLVDRFGDPPTEGRRDFRLTILFEGLTGGGSAGSRTATTVSDQHVTLHEVIHWWVGISSREKIPAWHESMTDYLAVRTMLETGAWTEGAYESFFRGKGAAGPGYERLTQATDPYRGAPLAFQRDLDRFIRERSAGRASLFDVVRYYHAAKAYRGSGGLDREGLITLIQAATEVDPRPYFDERY